MYMYQLSSFAQLTEVAVEPHTNNRRQQGQAAARSTKIIFCAIGAGEASSEGGSKRKKLATAPSRGQIRKDEPDFGMR
jgi:hypothetical protein